MQIRCFKVIAVITALCFIFLVFNACQKEVKPKAFDGYDVFLVIGQSNTLAGYPYNSSIDIPDQKVKQLGRFSENDMKVMVAAEPLENHTPKDSCIGFALTFAKLYKQKYLREEREVLIIPCGADGSGFRNDWNRGNPKYADAVARVNYVLKQYPGSRLKAFLWHQGESDVYFGTAYQTALDNMIKSMRNEIKSPDINNVPFIAGGLVPYWVKTLKSAGVIDSILRQLPARMEHAGFADPRRPFVIDKPDNAVNPIHYDAKGQRELGKRYFEVYQNMIK